MLTACGIGGEFSAGMTAASALLLVYSALLVPVQLSFWRSDDPCSLYPTVMTPARSTRCGVHNHRE